MPDDVLADGRDIIQRDDHILRVLSDYSSRVSDQILVSTVHAVPEFAGILDNLTVPVYDGVLDYSMRGFRFLPSSHDPPKDTLWIVENSG